MQKIYIKAAYVGRYKNAQHFAFMQFFKTAITVRYPEIQEKFPKLTEIFIAAFDKENEVFEKADRRLYNKELGELDITRDIKFRALRDSIKVCLLDADPAKVRAAEILIEVFKLYGGTDIISMPMDSETGVLSNLVEDLEGPYAEQIELLGMTEKVAALKAANDSYIEILADRTQFDADFGRSAVLLARKETDTAYHNLVNVINGVNSADSSGELNPFIAFVNAEIDRYRISIGVGVGGNSGTGSELEEEEGVRTKKATFKFMNGTTVSFQIEVGAPIEAPANTEGYKWKPEVPEVMPSTNKTFTEVPIDQEEEEEGGDEHEGMYKCEYYFDGELVATQWYHEGDPVIEPEGLLPDGWIWGNTPGVMPARDVRVTAVEED